MQEYKYIPGVCNIGPKETNTRRILGIISLIITLIILMTILMFKLQHVFIMFLIFPLFSTYLSFIQVRLHFCAQFGILGVYNIDQNLGHTMTIQQQEFLKKDREKALKIIFYSLIISLISTLIIYLATSIIFK